MPDAITKDEQLGMQLDQVPLIKTLDLDPQKGIEMIFKQFQKINDNSFNSVGQFKTWLSQEYLGYLIRHHLDNYDHLEPVVFDRLLMLSRLLSVVHMKSWIPNDLKTKTFQINQSLAILKYQFGDLTTFRTNDQDKYSVLSDVRLMPDEYLVGQYRGDWFGTGSQQAPYHSFSRQPFASLTVTNLPTIAQLNVPLAQIFINAETVLTSKRIIGEGQTLMGDQRLVHLKLDQIDGLSVWQDGVMMWMGKEIVLFKSNDPLPFYLPLSRLFDNMASANYIATDVQFNVANDDLVFDTSPNEEALNSVFETITGKGDVSNGKPKEG